MNEYKKKVEDKDSQRHTHRTKLAAADLHSKSAIMDHVLRGKTTLSTGSLQKSFNMRVTSKQTGSGRQSQFVKKGIIH